MKGKILVFLGVMMIGLASLVPTPAAALGGGKCGAPTFLGFKAWYEGLCNDSGEIEQPAKGDEADLAAFVWTIVLNIVFDVSLAIGYIAVGFVIYGGYLYIMAQGDPGKVAKGKKTLTSAVIGTVIALAATVIVNTITVALGINIAGGWNQGDFNAKRVSDAFAWAYAMAGIVAVAFIVKSGAEYLLSQGDPGRVQKATRGIIYAVIGLVVVILAAVITNFVVGSVGEAL